MLGHSVVKILLSGHVHTPSADIWEQDGGKYLSLTAGTLSTRRREWPCSFNILNFDAGMLSVSRYDLTSDGFQMAHAGQWRLRDLEQTEL
jgi:predicted phosphodiesterase